MNQNDQINGGAGMNDKETIDALLNDTGFRKIVESDIGKVSQVKVNWPNNEIVLKGQKGSKVLKIDVTLATLRNQFN